MEKKMSTRQEIRSVFRQESNLRRARSDRYSAPVDENDDIQDDPVAAEASMIFVESEQGALPLEDSLEDLDGPWPSTL
jgi:hypothetical protein